MQLLNVHTKHFKHSYQAKELSALLYIYVTKNFKTPKSLKFCMFLHESFACNAVKHVLSSLYSITYVAMEKVEPMDYRRP